MQIITEELDSNKLKSLSDLLGETREGEVISEARKIKEDRPRLTDLEKSLIILDEKSGELTQKEIAELHGVSQTAVSYIGRGLSNCDPSSVNEKLQEEVVKPIDKKIAEVKSEISDKLHNKLLKTLDIFEPASLEQKQMPSALKSLASTLESLKPKANDMLNVNINAPQFIVYQPEMRKISDFDIIKVNE